MIRMNSRRKNLNLLKLSKGYLNTIVTRRNSVLAIAIIKAAKKI